MIEDLWYKNAIIYNLDLETFMDVNGDGVGDFEGLERRLDYLQSLGIDAIWLAPFQPSPNKDNGYDISDYYGVDERHGSSGDFVEFMNHASKRGIKVMIDLVLNHTSDQHPWFKKARADKKSKYKDYYIWSKKKPSDWNEGMVFPGVQETTWTYDKKVGEYYYHRFYHFQPDLNMENPKVRDELRRIIGFWVQLGVAGFRLDAVPFLLETPAPGKASHKIIYDYLAEIRRFLQWRKGDAILLGEANVLPEESKKYFGDEGDGMHMMFNFFVNQGVFYALASRDIAPLVEALERTKSIFPTSQWAHFLRNHDELDLGRLSKDQSNLVFDKFAPKENMKLYNRGIRRRLSPMLGNKLQIQLAYSLLFSLPGTPVLYYGEEIGMGDNLSLKERNAVRTPMQWSEDYQAGFSIADKLVNPTIKKGPYNFREINVEAQKRDPDSLLNWITYMIRIRKECLEIGWGDWEIVNTKNPHILAICYSWRNNYLVTIHNFDENPHQIKIKIKVDERWWINLLENEKNERDKVGAHSIHLKAYGYKWFRVGDMDHVIRQSHEIKDEVI